MFTLFFLPHTTKMDECISINKIPLFTWRCCNIVLFFAYSFTRFKQNVLTSENVVVLPHFLCTLQNLTSFALIYFHKSRILTHLAYINFPKLVEKVANSRKLVRFSKPSEVNRKYNKKKVFLSPNCHKIFPWIFNKRLCNPKVNF